MPDDRGFPGPPTAFGETTGSPNGVQQATGSQPPLVFQSPALNQTFGNIPFVIFLLAAACSIILGFLKIMAAGIQTVILAAVASTGLGFGSLALYILLRTGRIVLNSTGLVEYNRLGFSRRFLYAQIIEVKRGSHANEIRVNYHPVSKNGYIDRETIHEANLISVERGEEFFRELSRRINAHPPIQSRPAKLILSLLLLVLFLIAGFGIVLFLFIPTGLGH